MVGEATDEGRWSGLNVGKKGGVIREVVWGQVKALLP